MNSEENSFINQAAPQSKPTRKKLRNWIFLFLVISLVLTCSWLAYRIFSPSVSGPRTHPMSLIPQSALYVLETDHPYQLWSNLSQTNLWELLKEDEEWNEYGELLTELEHNLSNFKTAIDLLDNRSTYISAHPFRSADYDFLYVFDVEGLGVLRTWLINLDHVTKRSFEGATIYEKLDIESKDVLYFSFVDNFLIASYTHTLIEASLHEREDAHFNRSFDFLDVNREVINEGLVRVYINYQTTYDYFTSQMKSEDIATWKSSLPFVFSGLYFDLDQESLFLEGYTNYSDLNPSYLNIFRKSGSGGASIANILPAQTSIYMSLGFDSFTKFYESIGNHLKHDTLSGEDYKAYIRKTEKFLGIDLNEDLVSWIDDELAFVQIEYENRSETALIIRAKKASLARQKMNYLSQKIKRKTPVRFKNVPYRGYEINYMAVKGLFKLILGGMFNQLDRPYYTILDEYVIFASKPNVLRRIIDDRLERNTLSSTLSYQEFIEDLGQNHSILLYLQLELLKSSNDGLLDKKTVELFQSKSNFLSNFPQLGFRIKPSSEMFETKILLSINNPSLGKYGSTSMPAFNLDFDSLWRLDPGDPIGVKEIEVEDLASKKQTENFEKGGPKYEVNIKNGLKHGAYYEYHVTGELKVKGKYKDDQKEGIWKYYKPNGELTKKEKYKRGKLTHEKTL